MSVDLISAALDGLDDVFIALSGVPLPGDWALHGRCRSAPAAVFFPGRGDDVEAARAVCAGCPVASECREYALAHHELIGVWGGTTGRERRHLRRARAAQAQQSEATPAGPMAAASRSLDALLARLTEHPGRWARVAHFASTGSAQTTASLLRTGRRAVPPGRWEFEGRRNPEGGSDLYALYRGADQE